ncbi:MAG: hypothetical protein J3R72DRAFT_17156 [Linnemannia gamsii]|nr:MAG: hypothetical protein J3R72DRAFT_17156 [Linnemannia gamsii]
MLACSVFCCCVHSFVLDLSITSLVLSSDLSVWIQLTIIFYVAVLQRHNRERRWEREGGKRDGRGQVSCGIPVCMFLNIIGNEEALCCCCCCCCCCCLLDRDACPERAIVHFSRVEVSWENKQEGGKE